MVITGRCDYGGFLPVVFLYFLWDQLHLSWVCSLPSLQASSPPALPVCQDPSRRVWLGSRGGRGWPNPPGCGGGCWYWKRTHPRMAPGSQAGEKLPGRLGFQGNRFGEQQSSNHPDTGTGPWATPCYKAMGMPEVSGQASSWGFRMGNQSPSEQGACGQARALGGSVSARANVPQAPALTELRRVHHIISSQPPCDSGPAVIAL